MIKVSASLYLHIFIQALISVVLETSGKASMFPVVYERIDALGLSDALIKRIFVASSDVT